MPALSERNLSRDNFRERFEYPASYFVWDTHERYFSILRHNHLPSLDQTYSAFMEDLDARGLLDETLVVLVGEMGRTPKINKDAGRDLWAYSVLLAGGGVRGGQGGASDTHAAFVRTNRSTSATSAPPSTGAWASTRTWRCTTTTASPSRSRMAVGAE